MKISIISFKTPTKELMIHKKVWTEISVFVEISTHFDSHGIIEYQIYCSTFPILQVNLGKKQSKLIVTKLLQIDSMGNSLDVSEWSSSRLLGRYDHLVHVWNSCWIEEVVLKFSRTRFRRNLLEKLLKTAKMSKFKTFLSLLSHCCRFEQFSEKISSKPRPKKISDDFLYPT